MLGPGFVQIAEQLNISLAVLSESTAWAVLAIGLSLFIISPLAKIYGRRPMFLFSSIVMLGTSIWGAVAGDYPSLLGARVLAGVGMAPYETLVQCVMGDIYFVHERATRIAFWNLMLMAGINGGTVVAGYIIEAGGFRWTFGACAVIFGILTIAVFFFVPETGYRRDMLAPIVTIDDFGNKGLHMRPKYQINLQGEDYQGRYVEISATERKKRYAETLHIFNGRLSSSPFWKVFLRSIVMMCYPAVIWAFLTYGMVKSQFTDAQVPKLICARRRNRDHMGSPLLCGQLLVLLWTSLQLHRGASGPHQHVAFCTYYDRILYCWAPE